MQVAEICAVRRASAHIYMLFVPIKYQKIVSYNRLMLIVRQGGHVGRAARGSLWK